MEEPITWTSIMMVIAQKTDWTTLGVAVVTALSGIVGAHWLWTRQARAERESVKAALLAEVKALLDIIERREYMKALVAYGAAAQKGSWVALQIQIADTFNRVYQQNLTRLGVLTPDEAALIVQFHMLLDSVRSDLIKGGVLAEGSGGPIAWVEAKEILEQAISIGKKLTEQ